MAMEDGMILEGFGKWCRKTLGDYWSKPISSCIKCMSSFYSMITYWPLVLWIFGFSVWEIPLFVVNVFILVSLNWFIYKRL